MSREGMAQIEHTSCPPPYEAPVVSATKSPLRASRCFSVHASHASPSCRVSSRRVEAGSMTSFIQLESFGLPARMTNILLFLSMMVWGVLEGSLTVSRDEKKTERGARASGRRESVKKKLRTLHPSVQPYGLSASLPPACNHLFPTSYPQGG